MFGQTQNVGYTRNILQMFDCCLYYAALCAKLEDGPFVSQCSNRDILVIWEFLLILSPSHFSTNQQTGSHHCGYQRFFTKLFVVSAFVSAMYARERWARLIPVRKLTPAHRAVGGPAAVAIGLSDSPTAREYTHRSWAVGAPARWAGVNFPRVPNLQLRASVWDSTNWNGSHS